MRKFLSKHKTKIIVILAIYLLILFFLGYKIPWFDKHPDWSEFPKLSDKNFIVEEIQNFHVKYKGIYHLPKLETHIDSFWFVDYYLKNVKNVKSIGFRTTENELEWGSFFNNFKISSGGNSNNYGKKGWPTRFIQKGYEYLELNIGSKSAFFKLPALSDDPATSYFYQYNYPQNEKDTLFIRNWLFDYRIYYKNPTK